MKNYLNLNNISKKLTKRRDIRKWKKQRIVRGFSDYDWWNLDSFLANLLANSLEHYANHTISWDEVVAATPEVYKERILNLATKFQQIAEWDDNHEDNKDYQKDLEERQALIKNAFEDLSEVFLGLWD